MYRYLKFFFAAALLVLAGKGAEAVAQDGGSTGRSNEMQHGVLVVRHDLSTSDAKEKSELKQGDRALPTSKAFPAAKGGGGDAVKVVAHDSSDKTAEDVEPRPEIESRPDLKPQLRKAGSRTGSGARSTSNRVPRIRTFRSWSVYGKAPWAYQPIDMTYRPTRFRGHTSRTDWTYHRTSFAKYTPKRDWTYQRR